MRVLSVIAILSVLPGCWSRSLSSASTAQANATTTTNAAGVKSMELTAPWKDMKLSIEGGVVLNSREGSLLVRFPATPADALVGLHETLSNELEAAGWTKTERFAEQGEIEAVYTLTDGREGGLFVNLHNGRPQASFKVR